MCVCINVSTYEYTCVYIYVCVCMYASMCVCMYICHECHVCMYTGHPANKDDISVPESLTSIAITHTLPTLTHPFQLISASGHPAYTNFTNDFKDILDYIYIENDIFDVINVAPFPTYEELSRNVALPSVDFPSDHIAVVVDIVLK